MTFNCRFLDRTDEAGNRAARFALVPFEIIDANGWDCCRERDESAAAGVAVPDATALVPVSHWYEHELRLATNQELANVVVSAVVKAQSRRRDGSFPRYSQLDFELGQMKQEIAKAILGERDFSGEQVARIATGDFWPED